MQEKHLHIVCMDVPYPADYGGVIDVFYKIKTLAQLGIHIHLHCFENGRAVSTVLDRYCAEVHYYHRKQGHKGFSHKLPYIVCSRGDATLLDNLLADDYPILLEGIHCTYLLQDPRFASRRIFLRLHNTEYVYYQKLCQHERSLFKKIYYWHESRLLKQYEGQISRRCMILAMSAQDLSRYKKEFQADRIALLPAFVPSVKNGCLQERGCYCLYHGNLSVSENERVAVWLLRAVFNDLKIPLVIAGKNPSSRLLRLAERNENTCLVADPSEEEMRDIISKAQVHVLPSFNATGIKFKLLNALFNGRHCVTNRAALEGTGLETTCRLCSNAQSFKRMIGQLFEQPFGQGERESRLEILESQFDNVKTARQLIAWIW
jgi:Glycosyl transferases group 1